MAHVSSPMWTLLLRRLPLDASALQRNAILSLRLRLHSGLRQKGGVFDAVLFLGLRPRL